MKTSLDGIDKNLTIEEENKILLSKKRGLLKCLKQAKEINDSL